MRIWAPARAHRPRQGEGFWQVQSPTPVQSEASRLDNLIFVIGASRSRLVPCMHVRRMWNDHSGMCATWGIGWRGVAQDVVTACQISKITSGHRGGGMITQSLSTRNDVNWPQLQHACILHTGMAECSLKWLKKVRGPVCVPHVHAHSASMHASAATPAASACCRKLAALACTPRCVRAGQLLGTPALRGACRQPRSEDGVEAAKGCVWRGGGASERTLT